MTNSKQRITNTKIGGDASQVSDAEAAEQAISGSEAASVKQVAKSQQSELQIFGHSAARGTIAVVSLAVLLVALVVAQLLLN